MPSGVAARVERGESREVGGTGLASTRMRALTQSAGQRGLEEMNGFALAANEPALRLTRCLGFGAPARIGGYLGLLWPSLTPFSYAFCSFFLVVWS
jgi:hypothetical protein